MDRYTCEEMFRLLDRYVDRDLSDEEVRLVEEHLARCTRCAGEFEFEASFVRELREKLARVRVPVDILDRVRSLLSKGSSH